MRIGKKANVVEAKKTRSCVVRLEKVRSPGGKVTRGGAVSVPSGSQRSTHLQDEKKFKGPFKKRPLTQSTSTSTSPTTATPSKVKDKVKSKMAQKGPKRAVVNDIVETPPTIAAGRSRRAIKPNPKYASDDMVTPKIIKNVATLGTSAHKRLTPHEKQRKRSTSSSEDFYNKESSDELGANEADEVDDKAYITEGKESDSDFSNGKLEVPVKRRGRPRKNESSTGEGARMQSTPVTVTKSAITPRSNSNLTQLQQLRKTLVASVNRTPDAIIGLKRKHDPEYGSESESGISRKRYLVSTSALKNKTGVVREYKKLELSNNVLPVRKSFPTHTINGNKIIGSVVGEGQTSQEIKRKVNREGSPKTLAKASPLRSQGQTSLSKSSPSGRLLLAKQRSSSPATSAITTKEAAKGSAGKKDVANASSSSAPDDFETMPTFTIVNINDIINKKGDVLISKTGAKNLANKSQKADPDTSGGSGAGTGIVIGAAIGTGAETKLNRRKMVHSSLLQNKDDAASLKSPLTRTPHPAKKPTQKVLNHTMVKRTANTLGANKPAPRILNAMVAKKTQPVKPMIANLDDSADESYPLSLDDEDEAAVEEEDESFTAGKRQLASSTPFTASKKSAAPATKENLMAATNRLPIKASQRKLSPEKVVISRQGDKIIKKITCFETWYVINIPVEDRKSKAVKNQLDIPLIELANAAKDIKLPTQSWSSKVTLHELSATLKAKSNLVQYTGDLKQYNIAEEDRSRYQPSCVMFRRAVNNQFKPRLPYDRAVIFKNKTFFTNIEGKNVKLIGAPSTITSQKDIEILLQIVDALTLQSSLVEPATTIQ